MPGTLYVVATPIGNLEDITLRALRTLREVALVAAEDTRRTNRLLQHFGIPTRTLSLHEHNERHRTAELLHHLNSGDSVALVSDAGTPLVSDPGFALVREALAAGIRVEPVPGPSAVTAALSVAGLPVDSFTFLGFAPARTAERQRWLTSLKPEVRTLIFFEAPHRIRTTLAEIAEIMGDRWIVVAREVTKVHESFLRGWVTDVRETPDIERGEATVLLSNLIRPAHASDSGLPEPKHLAESVGRLTESGAMSKRDAVTMVAEQHGVSAQAVYLALKALES